MKFANFFAFFLEIFKTFQLKLTCATLQNKSLPAKCRPREKRCQLARRELIHRLMDHNRIEHERKSEGEERKRE